VKLSRLHCSIAVLVVLAFLAGGLVYAHQGSPARSFSVAAFERQGSHGYMGSTNSPGYPFPNDSECTLTGNPAGFVDTCPNMDTGPYKNVTFNAYITYSTNALAKTPAFTSATINNPSIPMIRGTCGPFRCKAEYDFIDVEIGPDGSPYEEAIASCDKTQCYSIGASVVGRLVGGPSLH
jgi:hypothetical protein